MTSEYSKFVPKLKEVSEGLLHMQYQIDTVNGNDFHRIELEDF